MGVPSDASQLEGKCKNGAHQHQQGRGKRQNWCLPTFPSLERVPTDSYSSSICFNSCKWISFTYGLGTFQTAAFALSSGANECTHETFKSRFSNPYISMVLLDVSPISFQSQSVGELISWLQGPRVAWCGQQGKNSIFVRSLPILGNCTRVEFLTRMSLPLLPVLMLPFYPLLWRSYSASFQVFFTGNFSICSCKSVVSLKR